MIESQWIIQIWVIKVINHSACQGKQLHLQYIFFKLRNVIFLKNDLTLLAQQLSPYSSWTDYQLWFNFLQMSSYIWTDIVLISTIML